MSNQNLLNFCETWMNLIYPLKEIEHQQQVWFNEELWFRGSFNKDTSVFLEQFEDQNADIKTLFNKNCCELIEKLFEKINSFHPDDERLAKYEFKQALIEDPKWNEIIVLAQETYSAIDRYKKEVEHGTI